MNDNVPLGAKLKAPTVKDFQKWWEYCEAHLQICDDEKCELYWAFISYRNHLLLPLKDLTG